MKELQCCYSFIYISIYLLIFEIMFLGGDIMTIKELLYGAAKQKYSAN